MKYLYDCISSIIVNNNKFKFLFVWDSSLLSDNKNIKRNLAYSKRINQNLKHEYLINIREKYIIICNKLINKHKKKITWNQ